MNKTKKKFISKLKKKSKDDLIDLICNRIEELYRLEKQIEYLESLVVAHQQTLKFALNHQNPKFIYELVEEDDEDSMIDRTKKDSVKSYV